MMRAYDQDYAGWIEDTARAIEEGRFAEIDRAALADEVRDLGKSERREVESALELILTHMLKTQYQPEKETRSWELTIRVQRKHLMKFFRQSPSLQAELCELLADAYDIALLKASDETGLAVDSFPEICKWNIADVLGG